MLLLLLLLILLILVIVASTSKMNAGEKKMCPVGQKEGVAMSDEYLSNWRGCAEVVFFLRIMVAQCITTVPEKVKTKVDKWVGYGLCEVTALPSKLTCPITGKTFLNKKVYKDYYSKNKKKVRELKKNNNGKKPAWPKLPEATDDWKAFLNPKNHADGVIEAVQNCCEGSNIYNFSNDKLRAIDAIVRPRHNMFAAMMSGMNIEDVAGRNRRAVVCHDTKLQSLMALVTWYAIGESYQHNKWCSGKQDRPKAKDVKACLANMDVVQTIPAENGRQLGQCHLNAISMLLSNGGKGCVCVGYHVVKISCLGIDTMVFEAHAVYFDGEKYYDSTCEGEENMAKLGLFVPLVFVDKDGKSKKNKAFKKYGFNTTFLKQVIQSSYKSQEETVLECRQIAMIMRHYNGHTDSQDMMEYAEGLESRKMSMKKETSFFYRIMEEFNEEEEIRYLCRDMCDSARWLKNPFLVDNRPGLMGIPGLQPF